MALSTAIPKRSATHTLLCVDGLLSNRRKYCLFDKRGSAEGLPSAVKEGAQAALQPPKGTIGFPSGSGAATFFCSEKLGDKNRNSQIVKLSLYNPKTLI